MAKGIFNPFAKPKKNFQASTAENPLDTETGPLPKGGIKLDGDSYSIEFKEAQLEDIPARLGALITAVCEDYKPHLIRAGIDLIPRGATRVVEDSELMLPIPEGFLCIFVRDEKTEVEAFRRIAHTLHTLPIKELLAAHRAKITTRA